VRSPNFVIRSGRSGTCTIPGRDPSEGAEDRVGVSDDLPPAVFGQRIRLLLLELRDAVLHRALCPADPPEHVVDLLLEIGHPRQADLMNLVGRQVRRRVASQRVGVRLRAVGESPQPRVVVCVLGKRLQHVDAALPRRIDQRRDRLLDLRSQLLSPRVRDGLARGEALIERRHERIGRRRRGDELLHLRDRRAQDEARRHHLLRGQPPCLRDGFIHAQAHLAKPGDVALGVPLGVQRVIHDQQVREVDVRAAELLEREEVVVVLLAVDDQVQLPVHQVSRDALVLGHPCPIEGRELLQAFLREDHARVAELGRLGRNLPLERVLLRAGEVAGRRGPIRIGAHPLGREVVEECGQGRWALLRRDADQASDQNEEDGFFHRRPRRPVGLSSLQRKRFRPSGTVSC
jgi:hypothetical protein